MSAPTTTGLVQHTSYRIVDGELVESTFDVDQDFVAIDGYDLQKWICFVDGPQGASVAHLRENVRTGKPWYAQVGTRPVKVDGAWGGRNYPEVVVPVSTLSKVLDDLLGKEERPVREFHEMFDEADLAQMTNDQAIAMVNIGVAGDLVEMCRTAAISLDTWPMAAALVERFRGGQGAEVAREARGVLADATSTVFELKVADYYLEQWERIRDRE